MAGRKTRSRKPDKVTEPISTTPEVIEVLRDYVRSEAVKYLDDPNITSVGIGRKKKDGKQTDQLCIQFTVSRKMAEPEIESLRSTLIPKTLMVKGMEIPTDVEEREFHPGYQIVEQQTKSVRKQRLATIVPGVSVSHAKGTAGTLGAIVYDLRTGKPYMLSNWHVFHTPSGQLGDSVVQPGPYDDNRVEENRAGVLVRSHLGIAGDCAIASIENRSFDPKILDLDVAVGRLASADLGDRVVKSGRTTGVTYGVVTRIETISNINYGGDVRVQRIGCFEIGPDPDRPAPSSEVSKGGDSGSAWMISEGGKATDIMVGLHFAGEGQGDPEEYALACHARSVFEKLEIAPRPAASRAEVLAEEYQPSGYDLKFLGPRVPVPALAAERGSDVVQFGNAGVIPYTHFSVCLSKSRRMAHFVAWNIDGGQFKAYGRKGLKFRLDSRISSGYQIGDEIYADNRLDRGHLARRADLVWGPKAEAQKGNEDSFYFTNITPQHQAFNQSERHGLWGLLEDAIYEDVSVENLLVSVFAGPVFKKNDPEYRGIRIPRDFWKVITYVDSEDGKLKVKAYLLTQDNLMDDIEALELDPFRLYQVSVPELEKITQLGFGPLKRSDTFSPAVVAGAPEAIRKRDVREILSRAEIVF